MANRNTNNNRNPDFMNDGIKKDPSYDNNRRNTVSGEDFDQENTETNYGANADELAAHKNRTSSPRIEEGDEDYDDEAKGKDFEDYNEEYKKKTEKPINE